MKKILAIVLAAVMVLGMSSFAFAEDTVPMKIAVWTSNESQLELLGSFVQEFAEKKGINIDVTFESIAYADFTTKLLLELQGAEAPDVYWVTETSAPAFIASGNLAVLNDAMAEYDPQASRLRKNTLLKATGLGRPSVKSANRLKMQPESGDIRRLTVPATQQALCRTCFPLSAPMAAMHGMQKATC